MSRPQIIVIGTSAGGVEALQVVARGLPLDFPVPICAVMHTAPDSPGILDEILDHAGPLNANGRHEF
jgi:two-component system chemotaxis response regulator CheB